MTYCNACGQPTTREDHEFNCRIARAIRYGEASPIPRVTTSDPAVQRETQGARSPLNSEIPGFDPAVAA